MSLSGKKRLVAELQFLTKTRSEDLTSLLGSIKATVNSKECKKEKESSPISELEQLFLSAKEVNLD